MDVRFEPPKEPIDGTVKLSKRQLGYKRYEKLKELEDSGALARCKTRKDVAAAMSIPYKAAIAFISRVVRGGILTETLRSRAGRKSEYEYHFGGIPKTYELRPFRALEHEEPIAELTTMPNKQIKASPKVVLEYAGVKLTITLGRE